MKHSIFLSLAFFFFTFSASAQRIEADFFAVNVDTGFGFALNDGTRLDHNSSGVDVSKLDIRVAFNWPGDSVIPIEDHIDRVEWTVQHSGQAWVSSYITREPVNGEWSMCGGRRCRALKTLGSITINARAIYDDGGSPPVVHLVAEDSRAFRVVDTTPKVYIPTRRAPYCSGNRDKCNELVSNAGLWSALKSLCESRPGAEIGLGGGATLNCP